MAQIALNYSAAQINAAIAKINSLVTVIEGNIVQLYNGSTAIYPLTKAEAVFFDGDTSKTLDTQFSQLEQGVDNKITELEQGVNDKFTELEQEMEDYQYNKLSSSNFSKSIKCYVKNWINTENYKLGVDLVYRNDPAYGSGIRINYYSSDYEEIQIAVHIQLPDVSLKRYGIETLGWYDMTFGGKILVEINWDSFEDPFNSLLHPICFLIPNTFSNKIIEKIKDTQIEGGLNFYPSYLAEDCEFSGVGYEILSRYDIVHFVEDFWIETNYPLTEAITNLNWYFGLIQFNSNLGYTFYVFSCEPDSNYILNFSNLTEIVKSSNTIPQNGLYSKSIVVDGVTMTFFAQLNWEYLESKYDNFGTGSTGSGIGDKFKLNQYEIFHHDNTFSIIKDKVSENSSKINLLQDVVFDNTQILYENYNLVNWYYPSKIGYENPSVRWQAQYSSKKIKGNINSILIGPLKIAYPFTQEGNICNYKIYKAKNITPSPNDKTLIQEGTFNITSTDFIQYELSLNETLSLEGDYIFVYIEKVTILGSASNGIIAYPDESQLNYIIFELNNTWYFGSLPSYTAVPLVLQYKEEDKYFPKTIQQQIKEKLEEGLNEVEAINISLPDKLYAVVGDTFQLFYRGCIQAVNPYNYNILVSCSKGAQYPRYFEYTPTTSDIGTTSFKITIKDNNGVVLKEKSCSLITVSAGSSPSVQKNILCFGDSLTAAGTWCAEAFRRLTGSGGTPSGKGFNNITFCGSKNNAGAGYFGVGGWSWTDYITSGRSAYRLQVTNVNSLSIGAVYSNDLGLSLTISEINVTNGVGNVLCTYSSENKTLEPSGTLQKASGSNGDATLTYTSYSKDSQNPLWDYTNNKMTFIPYANKYCNGQIDIVYTLLSWNGQYPWRTNFNTIKGYIRTFADCLHSEFPNAKLKILGIQVNSVNGGMGANYGATGTSYADTYGNVVTALNQNSAFQEVANESNYSNFVEFVNVSSQFDSEYNMPYKEANVNTRNSSIKEYLGTNGVHPSFDGYMQIADIVYRNLIKEICQ